MTKIETIISNISYDKEKLNILIGNKFDPNTPLATPEEVRNSGRGICHESAIFMAKLFNERKIRYFTFIFTTRHNETGKVLHHSGSTWWSKKHWWIVDSVGKTIGFTSEENLKEYLSNEFSKIESPIVGWKNLGKISKFDWSYGEWISQL